MKKLLYACAFTIGCLTILEARDAISDTLYVAQSGSDTGTGDFLTPFRTISQAKSKSKAGDLISVFPGSYTNEFLLNDDGNLSLQPGVRIHADTNTGLINTSKPVTNTIAGDGEFRGVISTSQAGSRYDMFKVDNTNSVFSFTADRVLLNGTASEKEIFFTVFRLSAVKEAVVDIDYIGVTANHNHAATPSGFSYGRGNFHARIGTITNDGGPLDGEFTFPALECLSVGSTTPYDAHFRGDYLRAAVGFSHLSDNPNQVNWLTYDVIEGNSYAYYVGANSRGKNYISGSKKLWGRSTVLPTMMIHGHIHDWLQSDKIASDGGGWLWQENGVLDSVFAEWEDALNKVQVGVIHYGGTNYIHPGRMRAAGTCVQHNNGVQIYNSVMMDSSYGTSNAVYVTGPGLTLKNCTLIAPKGIDSIGAAAPQTVAIEGTLNVNTDPSTNIVFANGILIVSAGANTPVNRISAPWGSKYYKADSTNFWVKEGHGRFGWTPR